MIRVLVVDDHPTWRAGVLQAIKEASDIEVVGEAATGPELWASLAELRPDVVLLDLQMPGFDPFEDSSRIQEQHPERCRLFAQWKEFDWPILHDPINVLNATGVPIVVALDEHGVVRAIRPKIDTFEQEFLNRRFEAPANRPSAGGLTPPRDPTELARLAKSSQSAADWRRFADTLVLWHGDSRLPEAIAAYQRALEPHGHHAAQVLLTADDLNDRMRYLNVRNTLLALFQYGAIPIINENDTVRVDELQRSVGDNDRLAAMVTNLLRAPLLVLLSDVDGLYDGHPADPRSRVVPIVTNVDEAVRTFERQTGPAAAANSLSKGGMASKLEAARMVTSTGDRCVPSRKYDT